eukprot:scaffold3646_cov257-Chaetoceros_neogracile.AAC.15
MSRADFMSVEIRRLNLSDCCTLNLRGATFLKAQRAGGPVLLSIVNEITKSFRFKCTFCFLHSIATQ